MTAIKVPRPPLRENIFCILATSRKSIPFDSSPWVVDRKQYSCDTYSEVESVMGNKQDKQKEQDKQTKLSERLMHALNDPAKSSDDIEKLIRKGADVNRPRGISNTLPLHWVCRCKGVQFINYLRLLLLHGAKVNKVDGDGNTALHCVVKRYSCESCVEFAKVLIQYGARVNARDKHNNTPLQYAVHRYNIDLVETLLQHGADVNVGETDYRTPLQLAFRANKVKCGELLLQYDANADTVDQHNQTLLHLAIDTSNKVHWVKLLLQHGVDVDALDNNHNTALSKAASHCQLEIIRTLLDYSANANNKNLDRQTPVMLAAVEVSKLKTENNTECLELLIQASGQCHLPDGLIQHIAWDNELSEMLLPYCFHPRSLQELCRYQIRSSLRNQFLPDVITSLNLPLSLQRFVLLQRVTG